MNCVSNGETVLVTHTKELKYGFGCRCRQPNPASQKPLPLMTRRMICTLQSRFLAQRPVVAAALLVMASLFSATPLPAQTLAHDHPAASSGITSQDQAGIDRDIVRHFGDAPINPGPRAKLSGSMKPAAVQAAMRKVADWELNWSQPYFDRIWTWSVQYSGFMATSETLHDPKYRDAMQGMAEKFNWSLRSEVPNADDQSVGQTYLELVLPQPAPEKIDPTRKALDGLLSGNAATIPKGQADIPWWWCDALFMAPPVWSRMFAATHDTKYLAYIDQHWWETSTLLYDPQRHLYYRDVTFLHKTDERGNPIFWSRGNGWVMAGIARTLEDLPGDYSNRGKYEQQLREMAAAVLPLQDPANGLWHSDLLDPADYPQPEVSGSALITMALAWGVNHGVLPRSQYSPAIAKAWSGLVGEIYADGRLGNIQQTGSAPAHYLPSSSYTYGVGGFLLAGAQVEELVEHVGKHRGVGHPARRKD
jgi:rhamnogalacturonyl hydrolase YesR